jgi:two-component system, OmpR family, sensor histidine kinase KdpD
MTKRASWLDYAWALLAVAIASLVCTSTRDYLDLADHTMIYLLAVLLIATRLPRRPSAFAAIASAAAWNFLLVPPVYTFAVRDARHVVTFGVMLVVGLVVSTLMLQIREREHHTAALYAISKKLAMTGETRELITIAEQHLAEQLGATVRIELGRVATGSAIALNASRGAVGVILVDGPVSTAAIEPFVAQIALAIERALLAEEAEKARLSAETELTRNTLLAGLSHDLRNPLASIGGSAAILLDPSAELDERGRRELLETIRDESTLLTRLVTGLLDLVRIESGALKVKKELCPLEELLSSALCRLVPALKDREVRVHYEHSGELMLVSVDPVLFEQVLINLLENASKYSPPGTPIEVHASVVDQKPRIELLDQGPGLAAGEEQKVFERFYRASDRDRVPGAGLGLALCAAIVKAHGGTIEAHNRADRGTVFSIQLEATA